MTAPGPNPAPLSARGPLLLGAAALVLLLGGLGLWSALTPISGGEKPAWRVASKAGATTDLFAEPPEGYFAETKREADGSFRLTLAEAPKDAPLPKAPVRLTLARPEGALEFTVRLDGGRTTP